MAPTVLTTSCHNNPFDCSTSCLLLAGGGYARLVFVMKLFVPDRSKEDDYIT